jgi:hypothetical protein
MEIKIELSAITPDFINQIKNIIEESRCNVTIAINHALLRSCW